MLGVFVNVAAVLIGSTVGLVCRKGIPDRFKDAIMLAIGLCTLLIGIQGALKTENVLIAILSMVVGTAIGTGLDLDGKVNGLAGLVEKHFAGKTTAAEKGSREEKTLTDTPAPGSFAQGLVTAFLLWCIGAMTIVGSLQAGISHDYSMLFTKSLLDLISSGMLASSLGVGVIFAAVPLLIFQGGLVLLSGLLEPLLTASMINEITCVGSLAIMALGLNLIGITKIKVADFLPALLVVPVACIFMGILGF